MQMCPILLRNSHFDSQLCEKLHEKNRQKRSLHLPNNRERKRIEITREASMFFFRTSETTEHNQLKRFGVELDHRFTIIRLNFFVWWAMNDHTEISGSGKPVFMVRSVHQCKNDLESELAENSW
jgi:hypothetical protein